MKRILLILCTLATGSAVASAQVPINPIILGLALDIMSVNSGSLTKDFQLAEYDGSPFLSDKWQNGVVTWNSGKTEQHKINLFIPNDKFVVRHSTDNSSSQLFSSGNGKDSIVVVDFTPSMHSITMGEHLFVQVDLDDTPTIMEQLYSDHSVLLKRYTVTIKKRQVGSGYAQASNPRFLQSTRLYYAIGDNNVAALPTSSSKFYKIFGDKASIVKKYAKNNSLKINSEADIIKIFEYYDTL